MRLAVERVNYAWNRLSSLAAELEGYVKTVRVESECDISPDRDGYLLRSSLIPAPPTTWNFIVSEIVHHLRSALDNSVWHLASMNGPPSKPLDIKFPIVHEQEKWERASRQSLAGIPTEAIELIKSVQPFAEPVSQKLSWLALLAYLNNQDKHYELLTVGLFTPDARHKVEIEFAGEPPAERPNLPVMMASDKDSVTTYIKTGGRVLSVKGNIEGRAEMIFLSPDGHPVILINGLAKLAASAGSMVEVLEKFSTEKHEGLAST